MHLPDGTLANQVCTATAAVSAASVVHAISRVRSEATRRRLVDAAVGALVVFLAQMIDVPLFDGARVHLVGAAFLTVLAGRSLALLAMTGVIVAQALVLHDGGLATLGANVMNMAVVGVGTTALVMRIVSARGTSGAPALVAAASVAGVASMLAAAGAMSIELALSGGGGAFTLVVPAHASWAAWEAFTTATLVLAAARARALASARHAST